MVERTSVVVRGDFIGEMSAMSAQRIPEFDAVIALERSDVEQLRRLSLRERAALIEAACDGAVEIAVSRTQMGLPASTPAPWPESTWNYLADWTRRAREAR
jgi:hypothetical protein